VTAFYRPAEGLQFSRRAEEILEIAAGGLSDLSDTLLILDRRGGMRMLEAAGWSLAGAAAEFGAAAVYKVERRPGAVRVEAWDGARRYVTQSPASARGDAWGRTRANGAHVDFLPAELPGR